MNYDCGLIGLYIYLAGLVCSVIGEVVVDCSVCTAHAIIDYMGYLVRYTLGGVAFSVEDS